MTKKRELTEEHLRKFQGGDDVRYRSINPSVIYTPGVKHVAETGGAYWLIDAIASYYVGRQMKEAIAKDYRLESLHFWNLEVRADQSATLTATADTGVPPFITQEIPYTDFPIDQIRIWSGRDENYWVLYLPVEH